MLGIQDFWIALAWVLTILSTIGCVVYGALKWNEKEGDEK